MRVVDDNLEFVEGKGDFTLKPCPMCGKERGNPMYVKYKSDVGERWKVVCLGCMLTLDPGWAERKITVQEMWNKRDGEQRDV